MLDARIPADPQDGRSAPIDGTRALAATHNGRAQRQPVSRPQFQTAGNG
jgi:hypothetical protein